MIVRAELPDATMHLVCGSRDEARRWLVRQHGPITARAARLQIVPREEALRIAQQGGAIQAIHAPAPAPEATVKPGPLIDRERLFAALQR